MHLFVCSGVKCATDLGGAINGSSDTLFEAAHAGTYIVSVTVHELVGQFGIADQAAAEENKIGVAGLNESDSGLRCVVACVEQGLVGVLSDGGQNICQRLVAEVLGREDIVNVVVAACVAVKCVNAGLIKNSKGGTAVFQRT